MAAPSIPANLMHPRVATSYQYATPITPTDNVAIGPFAALWIGGAGELTVVMRNGDGQGGVTTVTFASVPAGPLPIAVQAVYATGTTATGIIGLG